jgi:hypothetical protein
MWLQVWLHWAHTGMQQELPGQYCHRGYDAERYLSTFSDGTYLLKMQFRTLEMCFELPLSYSKSFQTGYVQNAIHMFKMISSGSSKSWAFVSECSCSVTKQHVGSLCILISAQVLAAITWR